jgi:outer membrane murein-binding lipoprotein Lpp
MPPGRRGLSMIVGAGTRFAAVWAVLLVAGCSSAGSTACQCPKPVDYDDATIKKITAALRALPSDNILHEAMDDYEDERDDLRFCPAGANLRY